MHPPVVVVPVEFTGACLGYCTTSCSVMHDNPLEITWVPACLALPCPAEVVMHVAVTGACWLLQHVMLKGSVRKALVGGFRVCYVVLMLCFISLSFQPWENAPAASSNVILIFR